MSQITGTDSLHQSQFIVKKHFDEGLEMENGSAHLSHGNPILSASGV